MSGPLADGVHSLAEKKDIDEAFLREVDDELRRDQLTGWWRKWGRLLVISIGLGLVLLAGTLWWKDDQKRKAGALGETLIQGFAAADSGNSDKAIAAFSELKLSGADGYRAVAMLAEADIAVEKGDAKKAIAALANVATDSKVPAAYRDLALVRQTALEFDSLSAEAIISRLKPIAVAGNAWFPAAGEMTGIAYLRDNKPELAGPLFAAIARDEDAPASVRARVAQMAVSLGIDLEQQDKKAETGATE